MWKYFGGENDLVTGRITETEERFTEKTDIRQTLTHEMSLFNPFSMHGKETTISPVPFNVCVEWVKGPLGPHLKANPHRFIDGGNRISEHKYDDSTVLSYVILWDAQMLLALGLPIPNTYTRLLEASRNRPDAGQCFSSLALHSCLYGTYSKLILRESSIPAQMNNRRR